MKRTLLIGLVLCLALTWCSAESEKAKESDEAMEVDEKGLEKELADLQEGEAEAPTEKEPGVRMTPTDTVALSRQNQY